MSIKIYELREELDGMEFIHSDVVKLKELKLLLEQQINKCYSNPNICFDIEKREIRVEAFRDILTELG